MATRLAVRSVVLLGLLAPSLARAQQQDSLRALKALSMEQLLDVEVTSVSRRAERISQVASAIQVITQDDIRRSGAANLPQALRLASNLQVEQVDSRQWAISARGLTGTAANKLLVLIDGRSVYTPLFSGVFWDVQDVPLSAVDRIEVISGPGATVWGANAVNGVINVITKRADETQGLQIEGGGGSFARGLGTAQFGGALTRNAHYRVYGRGSSWQAANLPTGLDSTGDWHMGQSGVRVDWDASSASRLTFQGDYYGGSISQPNAADIGVSGEHLLGRWSRTMSPSSDFELQVYFDRTHRDIPGSFGEDLNTWDADFQHRFHPGGAHEIIWGLGYRLTDDRVVNSSQLAFLPPHVDRNLFTAFVQEEMALIPDRLRLTLGSKFEHNEYTGFEVQPGARASLALGSAATLWAAASRAVRTPSRIDREFYAPGQPPYILAGGPTFHSEEEIAYELGYRHQRGDFAVSVATFYNVYHGLRSIEKTNPPNPTPVVIANGQHGESYGAELTADYRVSPAWRLHAGYTALQVSIRPNAGSTDSSYGAAEAHDPGGQLFLRSLLDLPVRLHFDCGFRFIGAIANQHVPEYAELNARLSWQAMSRLELSLVGQNLLHRSHAETGSSATRREIERGVFGMAQWRF